MQRSVRDGIAAVENADRRYFAADIRHTFGDSLYLDAALQVEHPGENRWDYLLGHMPSQEVIGVEPHAAKEDQVSTVIRKRAAARDRLAAHLKPGRRVAKWMWVASGKVHFANTEKARRRLDENGIEFVGKRVLSKHLPTAAKGRKQGPR